MQRMSLRWLLALGLPVVVLLLWLLAIPQPREVEPAGPPATATADEAPPHEPSPAGSAAVPEPAAEPTPPSAAAPPAAVPAAEKPGALAEAPASAFPPPRTEGLVDEYKAAYAHEPRDSAAQLAETAVQTAFQGGDVPPGLFKSVLCHQTICKIEVHWSAQREPGYMGAMMRVVGTVGQRIAVESLGAPDANGNSELNVYVVRGPTLTPDKAKDIWLPQ
jgi:hypothetical protein